MCSKSSNSIFQFSYFWVTTGWYAAVTSEKTPCALVLTRQNLPQLAGSSKEALKGGYIVSASKKEVPDAIIVASGSEVQLGIGAQEMLAAEGIDVRVVSMPCMELFEAQSAEYKESVLPKAVRARVAVEALIVEKSCPSSFPIRHCHSQW